MLKNSRFYLTLQRRWCSKSKLVDCQNFLTDASKVRGGSAAREAVSLFNESSGSTIPLAVALGNVEDMPIKSLSFNIPTNPILPASKENTSQLSLTNDELELALRYTATIGVTPLRNILKEIHFEEHKPPYATSWDDNYIDLMVSTGSQDLITRAIHEIFDLNSNNNNDSIIIEAPCYSGMVSFLAPYYHCGRINVKSVEIDNQGMIISELEDSIKYLISKTGYPPKILYLIPNGQNPSGVSYSYSRKIEIYQICCKYNILIFEDDPYYDLRFKNIGDDMDYNYSDCYSNASISSSRSFQSIDVEGRVIRFDSISKIVSPGLRIGYATGPSKIIDRLHLSAQVTHLQTSGISQMMFYKLIHFWGKKNFSLFKKEIAKKCMKKRDIMQQCLTKYFVNDSKLLSNVEWNVPHAGLFYWLDLTNCYEYNGNEISKINDTAILVNEKAAKENVLMICGKGCYLDRKETLNCPYIRITYNSVTPQEMDQGIARFRNLLA